MKLGSDLALLSATALLLLSHIPRASAHSHGVNCRGAFGCRHNSSLVHKEWWSIKLLKIIDEIPDNTFIRPFEFIACYHQICALTMPAGCGNKDSEEYYSGSVVTAAEVKRMARNIIEHGCNRCGAVARSWPEDKDQGDVWCSGELRFDAFDMGEATRKRVCPQKGVCYQFQAGSGATLPQTEDEREMQGWERDDGTERDGLGVESVE